MIVLITGAAGSGKSTIASNLAKMISAIIIPQDSFYTVPFDNFPFDKDINVEGDDIIDWDRLCSLLEQINSTSITNIIVEGHIVAKCKRLIQYVDVIVDIDSPYELVRKRYLNRYSDNYSLSQLERKELYFDEKTWPAYIKYYKECIIPLRERLNILTIKADIDIGTASILEFIAENGL
jgi:uridine kinase